VCKWNKKCRRCFVDSFPILSLSRLFPFICTRCARIKGENGARGRRENCRSSSRNTRVSQERRSDLLVRREVENSQRCAILCAMGSIRSHNCESHARFARCLSTLRTLVSHLRGILLEERSKIRVATLKMPKRPCIRFERNSDDPVVRPRCRPRARAHTGAHNCTHVQLVHISQSFHSRGTLLGHIKSATHDSSCLACIDSTLCTLLHTIPLPPLSPSPFSRSLLFLFFFFFFSVPRCYRGSEARYDRAFFCPKPFRDPSSSVFRLIVKKISSPVYFRLPSYRIYRMLCLSVEREGRNCRICAGRRGRAHRSTVA